MKKTINRRQFVKSGAAAATTFAMIDPFNRVLGANEAKTGRGLQKKLLRELLSEI